MRSGSVLALVIGLSAALSGCETAQTSSETSQASNEVSELKLENLLQQALTEDLAPDREVVVSYVEIPPNTTLDRHWHPGEEFIYFLEGEAEIAIDGAEPIAGTPGGVAHVPYETLHTAITGEQSAKAIVFRVHKQGEPMRYLEEESEAAE